MKLRAVLGISRKRQGGKRSEQPVGNGADQSEGRRAVHGTAGRPAHSCRAMEIMTRWGHYRCSSTKAASCALERAPTLVAAN